MTKRGQGLQIDSKRKSFCKPMVRLLRTLSLTYRDIGKILVLNLDQTTGQLVTQEEFAKLNPNNFHSWTPIYALDVMKRRRRRKPC